MSAEILKKNSVILFQGDSITDSCRSRETDSNMGCGFAGMLSARLGLDFMDRNLTFHNRGVGGNDIMQLYARWREDAINLKPTLINLLIGINDCGRWTASKTGTSPKQFDHMYRSLIDFTLEELDDAAFILCEPFHLYMTGDGADEKKQRERLMIEEQLPERQDIVKRIAKDYGFIFVPLQEEISRYAELTSVGAVLYDGTHPTPMGHEIISRKWLGEVLGK